MYRYYVIIGSFRNLEGARRYNIDLVKKGFTPEILENENGLFRISVGGYDEENAARAKIAGIRAAYEEEHRDVWLLIRK
jgi:cell division protein FtsN